MIALCPFRARVEAAHVKGRGAGGVDAGNMMPLDATVHQWAHQIGPTEFRRRLRLAPLAEIAEAFEDRFQAKRRAIAKNVERKAGSLSSAPQKEQPE